MFYSLWTVRFRRRFLLLRYRRVSLRSVRQGHWLCRRLLLVQYNTLSFRQYRRSRCSPRNCFRRFQPACDESCEVHLLQLLVCLRSSRPWPGACRRRPRSSLTGPSILLSISWQAGRLPWIRRLSSLLRTFVNYLLMRQLPTLGSGIMTTPSRMDSLVLRIRNPPAFWAMHPAYGSLTRLQTLDAAHQLQRDAYLITSNLNVYFQPPWDGVGYAEIGGRQSRHPIRGYGLCRCHVFAMLPHTLFTAPWASSGLCPSGPSVYRLSYHECPVGSQFLSSRTRKLFLCLWSHTL